MTEERTGNCSEQRTEQRIVENRGQNREWFRTEDRTENGSKQSTEERMVQNRGQNTE